MGSGAAWVELGGERIEVEIADDDSERARGLMYRDALPRGEGMLFIFDRSEPQAFWMKNTRIPLDILYFGSDLKLVSASLHTPPCRSSRCPSYPSQGPARFVLELGAGEAERLGIEPGTSLLIDPRIGARAP